jgi:hypothetical protein
MGQQVYVLMELSSNRKVTEWHPVAVVTDVGVAEQWQSYGKNVDWVPLELDDTRYLQPGEKQPEFRPAQITPIEQRAVESARKLEETNQRLIAIIDRMRKQLGIKAIPELEELRTKKAPAAKAPAAPAAKTTSLFDDEEYNGSEGEL